MSCLKSVNGLRWGFAN